MILDLFVLQLLLYSMPVVFVWFFGLGFFLGFLFNEKIKIQLNVMALLSYVSSDYEVQDFLAYLIYDLLQKLVKILLLRKQEKKDHIYDQ